MVTLVSVEDTLSCSQDLRRGDEKAQQTNLSFVESTRTHRVQMRFSFRKNPHRYTGCNNQEQLNLINVISNRIGVAPKRSHSQKQLDTGRIFV